MRQLLEVRARLLEARAELLQVGGVLPAVGQLRLQPLRRRLARRRAVLAPDDVDVLLARALGGLQLRFRAHDEAGGELRGLHVEVDDARAALANVPVEQPDPEHDVRELVQLRHLVVIRQRGEGLEADAREDRL